MKLTMPILHGALCACALIAGPAHAKHNFSVDSVNQPVVTAGRATVPNCPDWSSASLDSAAVTSSNYGCAVNSNLAAMIADPQDLIHGRSDADTDVVTMTRAIKALREMEPTSKLWTTTVRESSKGGGK